MELPYTVCGLDRRLADRWCTYFDQPGGRNRKLEEGLWRRTQEPVNADESGWRDDCDRRRRLIHYRYTYDLVDMVRLPGSAPRLCLVTFYLMYCVTYPRAEIDAISARIGEGLRSGGWQLGGDGAWVRGDLQMTRRDYVRHPMDPVSLLLSADDSHRTLELTIRSHNDATGPVDRVMPWDVLRRGMRIKDRRENPIGVPDLKGLADYLPFHLEVGCGLSIEAGIPPLHFLHGVYQVTDREQGTFILDPARDHVITGLLASPESVMPRLTRMYRSCFLAEPSRAHWNLKTLANRGHLLEPVMTNNFDGLLARVGLAELYLRRYDQDMPAVDFDPRAKALLVIGSHADRRRVQQRARERGLKIFFLDPEGFWEGDAFTSYPLEGVRRGDFHCCQTASTAVQVLTDHLLKPEALG